MTSSAIDLDAYFGRIGYAGPRAPTIETLRAIHLQHPQAIPFENLNPLLRLPVRLDAQSLQQKLIADGRGGYCFEHNILFSHALAALGFRVAWLAARVMADVPTGTMMPRTHMLLLVDVEGRPHVADVGFGGLTLTGPLRLEGDVEQTTPHEPFRLTRAGEEFRMEARFGGAWNALYRFSLQEQLLPDYEVTSWYLSNHPASKFVTTLIAARPDSSFRYALRNNVLAVHRLDGPTERRLLKSSAELRETLTTVFRVRLPDIPHLDQALQRFVMPEAAPATGM